MEIACVFPQLYWMRFKFKESGLEDPILNKCRWVTSPIFRTSMLNLGSQFFLETYSFFLRNGMLQPKYMGRRNMDVVVRII